MCTLDVGPFPEAWTSRRSNQGSMSHKGGFLLRRERMSGLRGYTSTAHDNKINHADIHALTARSRPFYCALLSFITSHIPECHSLFFLRLLALEDRTVPLRELDRLNHGTRSDLDRCPSLLPDREGGVPLPSHRSPEAALVLLA